MTDRVVGGGWRVALGALRATLAGAFCVALVAGAAEGQAPPAAPNPPPGASLTVSLLTMGQGDLVWEKFGHNAIRVRDAATGSDVSYNWGVFDFEQPNFLGRFLTGETRYWVDSFPTGPMVEYYVRDNRSVFEQELNLPPGERARLRDFLEWNVREENRFYRYDYYRDNCSTRVRDALDLATGGALRRATTAVVTPTTYRSHTRRLTSDDAPVYTGIQLALGRPADRPISAWEEGFLPGRLQEHVRGVRLAPDGARPVPLVRSERALFIASRAPERATPPDYTPRYLAVGLLAASLIALLASSATRRRAGPARGALALAAGGWALVCGVLGTALLLAGTVTRHVFMGHNENLLLVNPLHLALVVLLPVAALSGARRGARAAARLAAVVAGLSLVALAIKVVPAFDQRNAELIALFLPPNLALAWAARRLAGAERGLRGSVA